MDPWWPLKMEPAEAEKKFRELTGQELNIVLTMWTEKLVPLMGPDPADLDAKIADLVNSLRPFVPGLRTVLKPHELR